MKKFLDKLAILGIVLFATGFCEGMTLIMFVRDKHPNGDSGPSWIYQNFFWIEAPLTGLVAAIFSLLTLAGILLTVGAIVNMFIPNSPIHLFVEE